MGTPAVTSASTPTDTRPSAPGSRIARNAFYLLLGQAGTTVLAVLLSAALGRWLGAADFGRFFLVTSMGVFAYVIVDWGQAQLVIREVARQPAEAGRLLGTMLVLRIAGGVLLSALTAGAAWLFGYELYTVALAGLMVLAMLPFILAQGYGVVFRGREHMELDSLVSVTNKSVTLGATLALFGLGFGLLGAVGAQAVGGIVAVVVAAVSMKRVNVPRLQVTGAAARQLMREGTPILMVGLAVAAHSYADAIVLSKLAPKDTVGWFGAARNVFGTLLAPASILASAAYPGLSRAAHDPALLRREVQVSSRPLVALAVLGGVGTYLFADGAIALIYGEASFAPAGTILKVFAPGMFLLFLDLLLASAVLAVGRTHPLAIAKWVSVVLTTGLAVVAVPYFQNHHGNGGIGVAAAFVASEGIMFGTALWILPSGTLSRTTVIDAAKALAAGIGTLALFHFIPALPLPIGIPLCLIVFAALTLATRLFRLSEVKPLMRRALAERRSITHSISRPPE